MQNTGKSYLALYLVVWLGFCLFLLSSWRVKLSSLPRSERKPNILLFIADDWGFPHAGVYGDKIARTPHFDSLARHGLLFSRAFCASPSCSPSRAAILTGRYPHQLEAGANLWSYLPRKLPVYPNHFQQEGYQIGYYDKGWGPGGGYLPNWKSHPDGYAENPAGPRHKSFEDFLKQGAVGQPFCFWLGTRDPHRPYKAGEGIRAGYRPEQVKVPPYLPDTPETRRDLLDYYVRVEQMDRTLGQALAALARSGRATNTLIIVTGDNGYPFDRAKTNLYDEGTRVPLLICWPDHVAPGRTDALVNLGQLAPTLLDVAGLKMPGMSFHSLLPLLKGKRKRTEAVYLEREVHYQPIGDSLPPDGRLSYPMRGVRTGQYLYIRNLRPERYFAGESVYRHGLNQRRDASQTEVELFKQTFGKRPAEELYDVTADPYQLRNLAGQPGYRTQKNKLKSQLTNWMKATSDPRLDPTDDRFDFYPSYRINR